MTQEVGTLLMKVQLVVVQGKPEGMSIPLIGTRFKIGRGEGCQLRPATDLVSREHAEFEILTDAVILRDLGSRNGTEVNGKKMEPHQPVVMKSGDLIKIGTLTFAMSIEGMAVAKVVETVSGSPRKGSLDDVSGDEIDAWLVSDESRPTPERPSGVFGGDTMTMSSFNMKTMPNLGAAPAPAPAPVPKPAPVPQPAAKAPVAVPTPPPVEETEDDDASEEVFEETVEEDMGFEDLAALQAAEEAQAEEFVDESNPFYVPKKPVGNAQSTTAKESNKDSSDAAHDILRKMMERRRASKS